MNNIEISREQILEEINLFLKSASLKEKNALIENIVELFGYWVSNYTAYIHYMKEDQWRKSI